MTSWRPKLCLTATNLLLLLLFSVGTAHAGNVAGTVTHLSGPLFARKGDGTVKTLALNSAVEEGDTLVTEKRTYGRIKLNDNSEITLRPNSTFKIEGFSYEEAKPEGDKASFNLVKGGLRAITGQVGKRNKDSYKMKTPAATIGIRGTIYDVQVCGENCPGCNDVCPGLDGGVYYYILEGLISITNSAGSQVGKAGEYVYARDGASLPVVLPGNPGLDFVIPPFDKNACGVR